MSEPLNITCDKLLAENEALRAECDRLREALECMIVGACAVGVPNKQELQVLRDAVSIARAALEQKGGAS